MFEDLEITGTYEPDSNLRKQLEELPDMGSVAIGLAEQIELVNGESALQIVSEGIFAGEQVVRSDAETPFGVISSYQGDLKLAAAMILSDSLEFGEPTVAYEMNTGPGQQESTIPKLTAEWHHHTPAGRESENKAVSQPDCVDTEGVSLEALEKQAKRWFASH